MHRYDYDGYFGPGLWFAFGLFWLILLGLVIWVVLQLLPGRGQRGGAARGADSPEDILDRRFAMGEIDIPTYEAQRAALTSARAAGRRGRA